MSLPSQNARPLARRTFMHRRGGRRNSPRLVIILVLVAATFGLGWLVWPGSAPGGDPVNDMAGPVSDGSSEPVPARTTVLDPVRPDDATPDADALRATNAAPATDRAVPPRRDPVREARPAAAADDARLAAAVIPPAPEATPTPAPAPPPITLPEREATPPPAVLATPARILPDPGPPGSSSAAQRRARTRLDHAFDLIARNRPVEARAALSDVLAAGGLSAGDDAATRGQLAELNEKLLFSPEIVPGDPFVFSYTIEPNDALSRLPKKLGLQVDWRFLQRINRIARPERIRVGQRIKVVTGPFHAVVHKHAFRLDLYLGDDQERVFVRSFDVGLGEFGTTPEGRFAVRPDSKLVNPEWVNPRNRDRFLPDDPMNPIGEHWLGLVGDEEKTADVHGYGIHGTIDLDSIGREASMGCVRMRADDVAVVWEVLAEGLSRVEIRP